MGIDINIMREVLVDGEWKSCEEFSEENISADLDVGRPREVMGLLTGDGYLTSKQYFDYCNGVPANLSTPVRNRINRENERWEKWLKENRILFASSSINYYHCTFKELMDFTDEWLKDMLDTGFMPVDFLYEDGIQKLERFSSGIYANDVDKKMALMIQIFTEPRYNVMKSFLEKLNTSECKGEFTGNLTDIPSENKRIIFWYS